MKKVSEEIEHLLKSVVDDCSNEDRSVRERQIRTWRRLHLFWEGFSNVWYSETAHDWRIWDEQQNSDENSQSAYDKPINVFRAYLETIIAALSVVVPPVKCYPDDADNGLDLATAKAGDKLSNLIYRHNNVQLLWLHALFIYCTEGMVCCYTRPVEDEKFGTYKEDIHEDITENHKLTRCPICKFVIDDTQVDNALQEQEINKLAPDDSDVLIQAALTEGEDVCPQCQEMMTPEVATESFIVTKLVGQKVKSKTRVCIDAYGGLNVKIPNYARCQAECPYLIYAFEVHYAVAMQKVIELTDNDYDLARKVTASNGPGSYDQYDQWGRLSPQYQNEYPDNIITEKHVWIRPAMFNSLKDDDDCNKLKEKYPNGAHVLLMNDTFVCAWNEDLDDSWTIQNNPLSHFVHFDPLGLLLTSVQEITNDLNSLVLQTIEHGVGITFADTAVLNPTQYAQTEVVPGGIFPVTAKTGKSISEGFHELKTATLSQEVMPFAQSIQAQGQLVTGALPSLFGGQVTGGSETASEYSMSRAQALQRQQNTWKMFTIWWKTIFSKAIPMAIKEIKEDERDVQRNTDGSFVNVFIRKAELEGKIGKVELEANENLPITWSQKKDVWMTLLQSANPQIIQLLNAPENLPILREALGIDDLFIPGDDDRIKQYDEIKLLLNSEPMEDPMQDLEFPSVEIDPVFDNHPIEFEICRKWIISDAGRQAKMDNPAGYKNVLLHAKMHNDMIQMQMMQQQAQLNAEGTEGENGAAPPEKTKKNNKAPIDGEGDVQTIQ